MNNKKIVDTLIACGLDIDKYYDVSILNDTSLDIMYWLKKGDKVGLEKGFIITMLLDLVMYHNDEDIEGMQKFEMCFDFLYNTFVNKHKNEDNFLDRLISIMASNFGELGGIVAYDLEFGKSIVINDRLLKLNDKDNDWLELVDRKTGEVVYENVYGIEKDLISGKVKVIHDIGFIGFFKMLNKPEENKLKVVFYNSDGEYFGVI